MKRVFLQLTEAVWRKHEDRNVPGRSVWINMSRCQEIWPAMKGVGSELRMNIPDMSIIVMEAPSDVIRMLDLLNAEQNDDGSR